MKAVVLQPGHELAMREVPEPSLKGPTEMLVKVTTAAICGSDIHIKYGEIPGIPPGTIIGHEFVGLVEEVGPGVKNFRPGDRVDVAAGLWCGNCPACKRGEVQNCFNGGVWGGGAFYGEPLPGTQTEYVRVPNADLCAVAIPDNVSDEQAVLVGDVFSTGYYAAREGRIQPGDTVVVYGCGPVGLAAVAAAQLFGPRQVLAVDMFPNRLKLAEHYGATAIDAAHGDAVNEVLLATDMYGADVAIEAIGTVESFSQCLSSVRRGGMVSIVGLFPEPAELPLPYLGLYGVRLSMGLANLSWMHKLMGLLESGRLDLSPFCTHTFALADAMEAYDTVENKKDSCLKVMLKP